MKYNKGNIPWNKGKKTGIAPWLGKKRSEDTKAKISMAKTEHGFSGMRIYDIWRRMMDRCNNPHNIGYSLYGGRGIKVCKRWQKIENFYVDMNKSMTNNSSLDRIDNNGNYEPSNCKWSTSREQANNRRNNVFIIFKGIRKTMAQWAREYKINSPTLWARFNRGWTIEKSLTYPLVIGREQK